MKKKWLQSGYKLRGGRGSSLSNSINLIPITSSEKFSANAKLGYFENFLVFNCWWEESDMDAEDLAKAALGAIDDWLDEEIVGFVPEEG